MFQVLGPRLRLDVPPDAALFGREIDREFPEVRRVVDDLYAELGRTNAAADAAFDKDVVWPPGGFWERRETMRVAAGLPHLREPIADFLAEFPRDRAGDRDSATQDADKPPWKLSFLRRSQAAVRPPGLTAAE